MNLPSNAVGLRFILRAGAFVDVVLPQPTALAIVNNFGSRRYQIDGRQTVVGECLSGVSWCINVDDVMAVHTAKLDQQPKNRSLFLGSN